MLVWLIFTIWSRGVLENGAKLATPTQFMIPRIFKSWP
jgi:hypothetical protein